MNGLHEQDLIRKLEQLGKVEPDAEATRHAVDRVRCALLVVPVIDLPVKKWATGKVFTAGAGVLLVAGSLAGWFLLPPAGDDSGITAVRAAMSAPTSVSYRQTTYIDGEPAVTIRLQILASGLWRAVKSDGSYTVMDPDKRQALFVNPHKREASLRQGIDIPRITLYDAIKNLANDKAAGSLPGQKIDGKDVLGFAIKTLGQDVTLWVDPKTYLPERVECAFREDDGKAARIVLDEFLFDRDLDPALFIMEPPAGYKTPGQIGEAPIVSDDPALKDLKFGMSHQEVEKLLGKPDQAQLTMDGGMTLDYNSRGLSITLSKNSGVSAITCQVQATTPSSTLYFVKTDKGIGLGASAANIIAAYGKPDTRETAEGSDILSYNQLQIRFMLASDKLVQMQISRRPGN